MFDRHKSMEPFESRCRWWLPASPTFQVPGTLAFSGTKFVAIMDEWVGADSPSDFPSAEVVHGKLADGTAFTIFDAFVQAYDVSVTIGLNSIAVGAHLEPLTHQQFSTATARMNGLDQWWVPKLFDIDSANGETNIRSAPPTGTTWRIEDQLATIGLAQTKMIRGQASGRPT